MIACRGESRGTRRIDGNADLSRLARLPGDSRRIPSPTEAETREFSRALVRSHLDWLCSFPGVACLVTDLERLCYGDCGLASREGSLWGVTLPEGGRDWMWDLAPRPDTYFHLDVRHRVGGYASFPKRAWLDAREWTAAAAAAGGHPGFAVEWRMLADSPGRPITGRD